MNYYSNFERCINTNPALKTVQERHNLTTDELYSLFGENFESNQNMLIEEKIILIKSLEFVPYDNRIQATLQDIVFRGIDFKLFAGNTSINELSLSRMLTEPKELSAEDKYIIYVNAISARLFLDEIYALLKEKKLLEDDSAIMAMTHKNPNFLKQLEYHHFNQLKGEDLFEGKFSAYFSSLPNIDVRVQSLIRKYESKKSITLATMAKLNQLNQSVYDDFLSDNQSPSFTNRIKITALMAIFYTFFRI